MVQMFSHCVLGSGDEMDIDELLATKLVTFMMEHQSTIFLVPAKLRHQVEEHLSHLKRVQVSTEGRDQPVTCLFVFLWPFMIAGVRYVNIPLKLLQ